MKEKKWLIKTPDTPDLAAAVESVSSALGLHPVVARLLCNRGFCDPESARSFLCMESEMLCNPFDMRDMETAVDRICRAVRSGERITVYGDYDVDGVTSVCTLYLYLRELGATVDYYIPNRVGEGYGVSVAAVDTLAERGTSLIVTVDTGITAGEEVSHAAARGMDFVITDHHECRTDLPGAVAVVNPHRPDCPYPFKELAGVGVVFKLICAYEEKYRTHSRARAAERIFMDYADLVAIGTIADVMPITGENRIIVSYGLKRIENTRRPGIEALMDAAAVRADGSRPDRRRRMTKVTSGYIGFTLAPRINAAGRIRTASTAVELFLAQDYEHAYPIAEQLCAANRERQDEENKIVKEADAKIKDIDLAENPVLVLDADNWHHGVIGIVSSRVTEKYSHPSLLISFEGCDPAAPGPQDVGKGSGRSIKGMNLVDALCYCQDLLVKFGGHELAAGLSVTRENLPLFRERINEYARRNLRPEDMCSVLEADAEIRPEDVTMALADQLRILEPYGVGNPLPAFILRGMTVQEISGVSNGKHTRMTLGADQLGVSAMYFSPSPASLGLSVGDRVDCLFQIDINEYGGRRSVQLIVRDIKLTLSREEFLARQRQRYEEIHGGAPFSAEEDVLPERADFALFYNFVRASLQRGGDVFAHEDILSHLCGGGNSVNYIKLKLMILVFRELNVLVIEQIAPDTYRFALPHPRVKTDLEKSGLLRRYRSQLLRN